MIPTRSVEPCQSAAFGPFFREAERVRSKFSVNDFPVNAKVTGRKLDQTLDFAVLLVIEVGELTCRDIIITIRAVDVGSIDAGLSQKFLYSAIAG